MSTWNLLDREGNVVTMRDGSPFTYTAEWTAQLGAKYLGMKRKQKFKVMPSHNELGE